MHPRQLMMLPPDRITTKIIFPVIDMDDALAFYRQAGFEIEQYDIGYAWIRHQGDEVLHLRQEPELDPANNPTVGYFHIKDADRWHQALSHAQLNPTGITDQPWGMREFTISDPSGNIIRFGTDRL